VIDRLLPLVLFTACTPQTPKPELVDTGEESPAGQIAVRFSIDPDLVDVMDESARGVFYGQVFDAEQVTALGPDDGAEVLDSIEHQIDLGSGSVATEIMYTSVPLTVPEVAVLGFLDSDTNAPSTDMGPDGGDPVTLPSENRFDVQFGSTTAVTVEFGMLYPSR